MGLQSNDLTALGFGITADQPPISLQPVLRNAIHLRYATAFSKGLPWYGFFLFRRQHVSALTQCLAPELVRLKPRVTGAKEYAFKNATLYSAASIEFIDEFPASGSAEITLPDKGFLGASFAQAPVHRVTAKIGFRGRAPQSGKISGLIQFLSRKAGPAANPLSESGATFSGTGLRFGPLGGWNALTCAPVKKGPATLDIVPPAAADYVILVVSHSATLSVQGYDKAGHEIFSAHPPASKGSPSIVTLSQDGLARIRLTCATAKIGLYLLLYGLRERPAGPWQTVRMIAKDADVIVGETNISGRPGDVVTGEVNADRITKVEFHPDPKSSAPAPGLSHAALIDLCWDTVANALHGRWERVPNYPYPMALPVAEPSYPCAGKPANPLSAEAVALSRVRYGVASSWGGPIFSELHAILTKLVVGGPGDGAMGDRTETFVDTTLDPDITPQLPEQNLLQLLELAALDPAMAQILGLYWADEAVVPGRAYDYIVLADHENKFTGSAGNALAAVNQQIPNGVDAWITFNHATQPRAPLAAPTGPRAVVLPDVAVDGVAAAGRGAVGLRWDSPTLALGYLRPEAAVRYLLWRSDHGPSVPSVPVPASAYLPLNQNAPCLAGSVSGTNTAQAPANWPPFALHAVDRPLVEGWYSYGISGIDIWGRYSTLSQPAEWRQWGPAPQPEPWYYQHPSGDRQLHGFAVRILDKTPPPPPAAVEATALDPDDDITYVRDGVYTAWWAQTGAPWWTALADAQRAAVLPLRVRWRWYPAQETQHPNTREFRIYFNPGSVAPDPDRFDPLNWQDRIFVCDYSQHVTAVAANVAGGPYRQYDVLLPVPASSGPAFTGVPLQPSLAVPTVYANISVSAADNRTHTSDQAKWNATPWGGRFGNESVLAAPAKIYRVWRTAPPAPLSLLNDERIWATKADYHSHSFRTVRWPASADLKAHVYSVLDGTLFMVERMRLDVTTLSAADLTALHTIWSSVQQHVLDQLTALRALKSSASDAAWEAACAALSDNALRGLAALTLHEESFARMTTSPVDDPDVVGPDDPAGFAPNALHRAYTATFDGRARNRYFLRVSYIDNAHNEGPHGPPSPPIYLPPAVPPPKPVIVKVTGGDRQATVAWTTANAEAGGRYVVYRTDNDYRLRDVRLMDVAATVESAALDPNAATAEWLDEGLEGGKAYYYCLVFIDSAGNASTPAKPAAVFVPDETPPHSPYWTGHAWKIQDINSAGLLDWPTDGFMPAGYRPVLRLTWETSTTRPSFVISRTERRRPGWNLVIRGPSADFADAQPTQFACIDPDADPTADLQYRIKLCNSGGTWSRDYATQRISPPDPPLNNP